LQLAIVARDSMAIPAKVKVFFMITFFDEG